MFFSGFRDASESDAAVREAWEDAMIEAALAWGKKALFGPMGPDRDGA
jgi:hypothetical protein